MFKYILVIVSLFTLFGCLIYPVDEPCVCHPEPCICHVVSSDDSTSSSSSSSSSGEMIAPSTSNDDRKENSTDGGVVTLPSIPILIPKPKPHI